MIESVLYILFYHPIFWTKVDWLDFLTAGWWFFHRRWYCFISTGFFFQLTYWCSVLYKLNIACYFQDVVGRAYMVENFQVGLYHFFWLLQNLSVSYLRLSPMITVLLSYYSFVKQIVLCLVFYRWKLQVKARSAWYSVHGKLWKKQQWIPIFYNIQCDTTSWWVLLLSFSHFALIVLELYFLFLSVTKIQYFVMRLWQVMIESFW